MMKVTLTFPHNDDSNNYADKSRGNEVCCVSEHIYSFKVQGNA